MILDEGVLVDLRTIGHGQRSIGAHESLVLTGREHPQFPTVGRITVCKGKISRKAAYYLLGRHSKRHVSAR